MNAQTTIDEVNSDPQAGLEVDRNGENLSIILSGTWTGPNVHDVDSVMRGLDKEVSGAPLFLDMAGIDQLDTAGAWIIRRLQRAAEESGRKIDVQSNNTRHLELLKAVDFDLGPLEKAKPAGLILGGVAGLGKTVVGFKNDFFFGCHIVGASIRGAQMKVGRRSGLRVTSVFHQMEVMGLQAVPIIALMSFLIGVIIAQQGALQLKVFGAEIFVVNLVGILHLREIGVLLTSIMVAGRTGSAITAELGAMKMREEVDALTVIGLSPVGVLIAPRIFALMLVLPMLVIVSNITGMLGAILVSWLYVDIPPQLFINKLREAVDLSTLLSGLIKAPFMALIIGIVASIEGMKVSGSAESLGKHTTAAVVKSIFVVIVVDSLFAVFYGAIDY